MGVLLLEQTKKNVKDFYVSQSVRPYLLPVWRAVSLIIIFHI